MEEANGGLVGLPGVRAWNCMVEAAAIECAQGELQVTTVYCFSSPLSPSFPFSACLSVCLSLSLSLSM